jgi:hypothetical protein
MRIRPPGWMKRDKVAPRSARRSVYDVVRASPLLSLTRGPQPGGTSCHRTPPRAPISQTRPSKALYLTAGFFERCPIRASISAARPVAGDLVGRDARSVAVRCQEAGSDQR